MTTFHSEGPAAIEAHLQGVGVWNRQSPTLARKGHEKSAQLQPEIPPEDWCPVHLMTDGDCTVACIQACRDLAILIADYEIFWRWDYRPDAGAAA